MKKATKRKLFIGIGILIALHLGLRLFVGQSVWAKIDTAGGMCLEGNSDDGLKRLVNLEAEVIASGNRQGIALLYKTKSFCLAELARKNHSEEGTRKALAAAETCLSYLNDGEENLRARCINLRGAIYMNLAGYENPVENSLKAVDDLQRAQTLYANLGDTDNAFYAEVGRGNCLIFLERHTNKKKYADQGVAALESALTKAPFQMSFSEYASVYLALGQAYQASRRMQNAESAREHSIAALQKALYLVNPEKNITKYLFILSRFSGALFDFAFAPDRSCHGMLQCYDDYEVDRKYLERNETLLREEKRKFSEGKYNKEYLKAIEVGQAEVLVFLAPFRGKKLYLEAIGILDACLPMKTQESLSVTSSLLARACYRYGQAMNDKQYLRRAIEVQAKAIAEMKASTPLKLGVITDKGFAHLELYRLDKDRDLKELHSALHEFRQADSACDAAKYPDVCFITGYNLGDAYAELAGIADSDENRRKAIAAYEKALKIPGLDPDTVRYKRVQQKRDRLGQFPAEE